MIDQSVNDSRGRGSSNGDDHGSRSPRRDMDPTIMSRITPVDLAIAEHPVADHPSFRARRSRPRAFRIGASTRRIVVAHPNARVPTNSPPVPPQSCPHVLVHGLAETPRPR